MQFPVALVPWVTRKLEEGHSMAALAGHLMTRMGYATQVAAAVVQSARNGVSHLQAPAAGTRPDVARDEQGFCQRDVRTVDGARARVVVELATPHILVFRDFIPQELVAATSAQLADEARRVDAYVNTDRAQQDYLLPGTGASGLCLQAAANALNWPEKRWGLPLVRDTYPGQEFNLHYDAFGTGAVNDAGFKARHGDISRIGTLLLYLQPAELGGSTYFANLGLRVCLDAGDAVFFGYPVGPLPESGLLHGGEKVHRGAKRIMTLFCYDKDLVRD